jgi:hypothetical protein
LAGWLASESGGDVQAPGIASRRPEGLRHMIPLVSTGALMMLLVASMMQIAARTYNPFIYFRF